MEKGTQGKTNLKHILIVVILAIITGGGILTWQYGWIKELNKLAEFTEVKKPEKVEDETADWNTYINSSLGYSIKHPSYFQIDEFEQTTILYKEKLKALPPADPYIVVLVIYDRSTWGSNAKEACEAELSYCRGQAPSEIQAKFTVRDVKVNNALGVKISNDSKPLLTDLYLSSIDGGKIVRIIIGSENMGSQDTRTEEEQYKDFILLQKILSTFRFLE